MTGGNVKAVYSWIGNTPAVAMTHYAQVTDADMKEAAKQSVLNGAESDYLTDCKVHNPAHQRDNLCHTASYTDDVPTKSDAKRPLVTQCDKPLGGTGLEPVTSCV